MNWKWILDPTLGARARAVVVQVTMAITAVTYFVDELDKAGWIVTPALIISILGNWTKVGDKKD